MVFFGSNYVSKIIFLQLKHSDWQGCLCMDVFSCFFFFSILLTNFFCAPPDYILKIQECNSWHSSCSWTSYNTWHCSSILWRTLPPWASAMLQSLGSLSTFLSFFFSWRSHWDSCLPSLPRALTPHHELPLLNTCYIRSDQISHSVVSNSLRPHESQHARPPCPSPTPGVHSDSRPSSQWFHPAISSSVVPFSSCPQSLPASESFPMSQLFVWGGQSTGVSALASFLPKRSQGWSPLEWTGWISLQPKGLSRVFSNTTVQKHQFFSTQPSSQSNYHIHTWPQEKP